jgi:glucose-6-phosphate 1-epimerase
MQQALTLGGLTCHRLTLPNGDSALVADWGAHVLSWTVQGTEQLYLSPTALLDGQAAIRGGVPVCWPQFADRGPGAKHGWARQRLWSPDAPHHGGDTLSQTWHLQHSADASAPAHSLALTVSLSPGALHIGLQVTSQATAPWAATGALHTYLRLADVQHARLGGWGADAPGWDSVAKTPNHPPADGRVVGEIDRIDPCGGPLTLSDGPRRLRITQGGWPDTVVWNPGPTKCAALPDMPAGDERHMVCVEAAQALQPLTLAPGVRWAGWQRLQLL